MLKLLKKTENLYNELKYSLRSLEQYLPWHKGTIYIVIQNELDFELFWLNSKNKRIKIITQSQIIPEHVQQTRNRYVIEMYLDKIPNISERFVYLKPNHFFINYTHPRFFFNKDFYPKYNFNDALTNQQLNVMKNENKPFLHTYEVIMEYFGKTYVTTHRMLKDAPCPLYRDLFDPTRTLYEKQLSENFKHINTNNENNIIPLYILTTYNIYGTEQPFYPEYVVGYGSIRNAPPPILNKHRTINYYGFDITSNLISNSTLLSDITFSNQFENNASQVEEIKTSNKLFCNIKLKEDDDITIYDVNLLIDNIFTKKSSFEF